MATKKPVKPQPLTVRQARLVKATAMGKNRTEAGLYAKPDRTPESARTWASETLQKPTVKQALYEEMARQGIDIESVVRPVADGLKADKVSIVGNGDQAMAEITPDHNIRLKSAQIASRWIGIDGGDSSNVTNIFNNIQIQQKEKYNL